MQSEQINELAEALAKAQGKMEHAKKDATNPHFKSSYAPLPAIVDAIRAELAGNGLSYIQSTEVGDGGEVVLVTTLAHKSGQWVKSFYPVRPVQNTPQGFGSALTYARRYSLAAITGIAAEDEDDDGNAASGFPQDGEPRGEVAGDGTSSPGATEFGQLVAEAHAMQLNDKERKFVNDQHERLRSQGAKATASPAQLKWLREIVARSKSAKVAPSSPSSPVEPPAHILDDGIRY